MEAQVLQIKIHNKLVAEFYALRSDIEFVRAVLIRLRQAEASPEEKPEVKP